MNKNKDLQDPTPTWRQVILAIGLLILGMGWVVLGTWLWSTYGGRL